MNCNNFCNCSQGFGILSFGSNTCVLENRLCSLLWTLENVRQPKTKHIYSSLLRSLLSGPHSGHKLSALYYKQTDLLFFNFVSFWGFYWILVIMWNSLSLISHSFLKMTNVCKVFLDVDGVVFWMDGCAWAKKVSMRFQVGLDVWTGLCEALAARGTNFYSPHGFFTRLLTSGQDVKCFPTLHATMSAFIVPFFDWRWEGHRIAQMVRYIAVCP